MGFFKRKESFTCFQCGYPVDGDGYTNHCPKCLFSRHVDVSPGDRAESCGGPMEPVSYSMKGGEERILHRCAVCGYEKENRISVDDDRDAILKIMKGQADRFSRS